ncbi:MAG: HIT domain-containing protein [Kiritimatiellae bacterium]|nr:HIT domain-containing protein [Kiritimatiellia bacterium]MBQ9345325.1 HIT domain-containing protein [Kiritimatiellia bacterium]
MNDSSPSPTPANPALLWAPWRMDYLGGPHPDGCFLCRIGQALDGGDDANFVVWRGQLCYLVLNRYPYAGGHLMAVPYRHIPDLTQLTDAEWTELRSALVRAEAALDATMHPQGYNIGINQGTAAGAGAKGHLHLHLVPRWTGDSNFMPVVGGVRVESHGLGPVAALLRAALAHPSAP